MMGAIVGDVAGSVYERRKYRGHEWEVPLFTQKSRFTDDTAMTCACMRAVMDISGGKAPREAFRDRFREYCKLYPDAGYGRQFREWADNPVPYDSWGNGSAMRVSPVGWYVRSMEEAEALARESAMVSHSHPEGVKGAQSVAAAIFLARQGKSRKDIREYIQSRFGYDLSRSLVEIGEDYRWSSWCQKSVPEAIVAFLDSDNFEGAIRGAIWLGGDADTQAAIAGSIAEPFYGEIPEWMRREAEKRLPARLREDIAAFDRFLERG